ncbi:aldehyde dehydrogenase family protein [Curtobacterium sp. SORGH_AS_0776]|uniref:aldehyde dehydrogenase family protein n=2 Tax=unclassified Curtobacterium TaxID=257496 RepID=UPI002862FD30|nr:aldehyde dehydrogenase family protein [Curtobacterium sp. SORGH_AS_0776]MDR6171592.1 acyl-CoA reductase-like NAD-dependent aldehyde dehydrogenase [Curtobacterium sp. SORGH_AS_0776]
MTLEAPLTTETDRDDALVVTDPTDGTVASTVVRSSPDDVRNAVARARAAAPAWARTAPAERGALLHAAAAHVRAHAQELADLNTRETGKVPGDALGGVEAGVGTLVQYAELGPVHRGEALRGAFGAADWSVPHPRGVVLALTPWNDPVAVACGILGAAIVTGNTVVHKGSERSPATIARLNALLAEVLPDGVLVGVDGDGATGELLLAQDGIDVYAHVGSTATGDRLSEAAVRTRAHVVRENGGNDAVVVDADVDPVWAAAQVALGAFANTGQICTSVERVYVHRAIAEPFVTALVAEAERRTSAPAAEYGPLVDDRLRRTVQSHVDDALERGASARTGGATPDGPGAFYPATVLTGVTDDMLVMTEETFGPIAPVRVVEDFDEGLRLAAADRYGLAATVLTNDTGHALRAAAELPVGTVKVNAVFGGAPGGSAQPRGASGAGFGYGPHLLDELTTTTVVHLEAAPPAGGAR